MAARKTRSGLFNHTIDGIRRVSIPETPMCENGESAFSALMSASAGRGHTEASCRLEAERARRALLFPVENLMRGLLASTPLVTLNVKLAACPRRALRCSIRLADKRTEGAMLASLIRLMRGVAAVMALL